MSIKRLAVPLTVLGFALVAVPADAATFTVVNTDDGGGGSLRSAIVGAEDGPSADVIKFEIPGQGLHTIRPLTPLPTLSHPVEVRGYSQRGAEPATAEAAASPTIVLDASNVSRGIDVGGDDIEIRGLVIRDAQDHGIYLEGRRNVVAGNHIGVSANGTAARPNGHYGIEVFGGDNTIGGPDPAARNVISSNAQLEIMVTNGTGHVIEGNRIGTDAAGTTGLAAGSGIVVATDGNVVRDNLISGEFVGVEVWGDDNVLEGNSVGTDATGSTAVANALGINVEGGDRNVLEGNLVSGNDVGGLQLETGDDGAAEDNEVRDNLVGVDAGGTAPLPNGGALGLDGVRIVRSNDNTLEGNVISANTGGGVTIEADGADNNRLEGNWIGTDASGQLELGNEADGVRIVGGDGNQVTGANAIVHNDANGVSVVDGTSNTILGNVIHGNGDLAIDLADDGATANDADDLDVGANNLQNHPVVHVATATSVNWSLDAVAGLYRLEFYANGGCPAGSGEGEALLDTIDVWTDGNGQAAGKTATAVPPGAGARVSMTATRMVGFLPSPLSTSEFSPCVQAP